MITSLGDGLLFGCCWAVFCGLFAVCCAGWWCELVVLGV